MAILSNINGKFAVDSTGAIQLSGSAGTANYVLVSGGAAAAPTWVAGSTVIGGPYLPLSGGTLTGATATSTGISFTVGGILTTDKILIVKGQNVAHGASQLRISQEDTATSELRFYGADASTAGILRFLGSSSDGSVGGTRFTINSDGSSTFAGQVLCDTNTTTPTSGDAAFYKSSAGAVLSGYQVILETGSAGSRATGLTIDNSQNATFAGNILFATDGTYDIGSTAGSRPRDVVVANSIAINTSTGGAGTLNVASTGTFGGNVTIDSTGSADFIADRANTSSGATYQYKTAGTLKWYTGLRGLVNDDFYIFNNAASTNALIITASDSNATFAGDVTISKSNTAQLQLIDTTNNVILLQGCDDTNAFIRSYVGPILLQTNGGTTALTLDSSQNATFAGKILAGTGATAAATINAYTATVSASLYSALRIIENSGASSYWDIGATGGSPPDLNFYVNGGTTPKLTIDGSGNVGIGYTGPYNQISGTETTLAVSNSNAAALYLNNTAAGGHNHILFSGTGGALSFYDKDRADYNMVIDSSGNVGIGTTSPSTILQVESTDPIITLERNNNGSAAGAINFQGNDNVVDWQLGTNQAIGLGFEINEGGGTNNRFYIAPGGYTKIKDDGDTTWDGYDFHAITQSAASEPTVMIYNDNAGGNNYGINVIHRSTSANTTGRFFLGATNNGGTENIKIYTNGNIQNTNNSYTQLSDSRLKENIVDATSKLEEIKRLRVVNWNFIGDDLKQIGMVAQEVEEIFPGLVDVTGDNQIIHGTTYENVKSLKYSVLVPILVKAIQELEARVTELENN